MAVPAWPVSLPPLIVAAKTEELVEAGNKTVFDDGPPRSRRRSLIVAPVRSFSLSLSRAQFVTFRNFVLQDLNSGNRRFTAPVRLPSGALGTRTCRIESKISEEDLGPRSIVALSVQIFDW